MVSKNNKKLIAEKNRRNEKQRFAIRKLNVGVASVLLGITFSIYGGGQVVAHADTNDASDQVATSDTGNLAEKSEVASSGATTSANQPSASATSANGAAQSQSSANSQPAATANTPASESAVASSAAVKASKDQSTAENQPSPSQEVQTPAQENGSGLQALMQLGKPLIQLLYGS
ncbi:YSIRK-type signal peptide-containing protein [Limosilactobacillus reuteri]|uniref:YSIRK-type signal peptide-containing protein n=1 Tax=Limosilactobacillus reuteri TaxID=1598 RepID=UPI001E58334C|nr:YSIRK-type signal peptide-containing protein [Limosilactobacillus reuteri]MCC4466623.1 YSIRK-type signal peptide-containing protein [Limosilactobacillus reuteri]MCC4473010.1 YSIRK-type signal peptide-containing protein [Limosilactobacillus reuteri]